MTLKGPIPPPEFLVEELSFEGRELLDQMLVENLSPEEAVEEMRHSLPKDRATLWKITEYLRQAYEIEREHIVKGYRQSQLAQSTSYGLLRLSRVASGATPCSKRLYECLNATGRSHRKTWT